MAEVCVEIIQRHGRSKALQGLRMAINDIFEDLADIPSAEVTRLYKVVNTAGLITLSELRHRYSSSFKQVGTRALIRNEIEYHLINGIVVNQSSDAEEQELIQ